MSERVETRGNQLTVKVILLLIKSFIVSQVTLILQFLFLSCDRGAFEKPETLNVKPETLDLKPETLERNKNGELW